MDRADFVHMVRLSEQASAEDSRGYRRSVAAFAALGYAWVIGFAVLAAIGIWWALGGLFRGRISIAYAWILFGCAGLLWTCARALWCRSAPSEGVTLKPADAPALFEAIERVRRSVRGPVLDEILLHGELNAGIRQQPRWGLFGRARNSLTIGLPMLMALDRQRFLAVLAHEYGHLRGGHGRFSAWIYRTRLSWARFHESLADDNGIASALTRRFLHWYFPRFLAKTFALARQDEYEADRISGKLVGTDVAGSSLKEVDIKGQWLAACFWRAHWASAAQTVLPVGPYASMRKLLALPPPDDFARRSLREALRRTSGVEDTHPVLRDRLEALDASRDLPAWSQRPAIALLGKRADEWISHFDRLWCRDNATAWKEHHGRLRRVQARADELASGLATRTAAELMELAALRRRLDPSAPILDLCELALQRTPGHGRALSDLIDELPARESGRKLALLEELHARHAEWRWWSALTAVGLLEADPEASLSLLKEWRTRFKAAEDIENAAIEAFREEPLLRDASSHDLGPFELEEVQRELADCAPIARAWLLRKRIAALPARRAYVLYLELDLAAEQSWNLCRSIERQLPLPGPVVAGWISADASVNEVQRQAGAAIYARAA